MGAKQSSTAAVQNQTRRKRANTQTSIHQHPRVDSATKRDDQALTRIKTSPAAPTIIIPKFDEVECLKLFRQYADADTPDLITPDGTQRFFADLGLSIEDVLIFAIAWKMHNSTMGYITKDEWMKGMKDLKTDSIEKLREKRPEFEKVLKDPQQFEAMYKYTFNYAKNKDQKCMDTETASVLWTMLLSDKYPIVHSFVQFLKEKNPVRVINKDQWLSFLDFVTSDIAEYDESSAWPVLFDEFVDWKKQQP